MKEHDKMKQRIAEAKSHLTKQDYSVSATALMLDDYLSAILQTVNCDAVQRVLDIGCAYGGVAKAIAVCTGAVECHGIDLDDERLAVSRNRGIITTRADTQESLPYPDDYFDLVSCNGVIEHLIWYDDLLLESRRVLRSGGYLVIAMPNLANYIQRLVLLLGYQPTDVCISRAVYAGTLYNAGCKDPERHIRSATPRAMRYLLEYYGYKVLKLSGADPTLTGQYRRWAGVLRIVGKVMPTSLSRRLIIISQKQGEADN